MNVNELLDTIEDTLEESAGMPLSGGKRIVDVEQIRDYLDGGGRSARTCLWSCGRPSPLSATVPSSSNRPTHRRRPL